MRNLSYENELFLFHANKSHFHKNDFALRLAFKQRHKGTRKWPIVFLGKTLYSHRVSLLRGYIWVPENLIPGVTLWWTCNPSRGGGGGRNTPSRFTLKKLERSPSLMASVMSHLVRMQSYLVSILRSQDKTIRQKNHSRLLLKGPSQPHFYFCLHARVWQLYVIRSKPKWKKSLWNYLR